MRIFLEVLGRRCYNVPAFYRLGDSNRKMKKRTFALILAFAMLFALSACSASSSSTSTTTVSTSVTDSEGNTTTNTVTNEMGISAGTDGVQTTNETTTETTTTPAAPSMADFFPPEEEWYDIYSGGGEGTNEEGDSFYFAYNDPENVTYAMVLIAFADGDIMVRNGDVNWNEEENCLELIDEDMQVSIPFLFLDTEEEDCFVIRFLANETEVLFESVDQETIISDVYSILSNSVSNAETADEADAES